MKIFLRKSGVFAITLLIVSLFFVNSASSQIAPRGTATTGQANNGTTLTIGKPSGVVAGDIMFVNIVNYNTITSNPPSLSGWTTVAGPTNIGGTNYANLLYRVADGTEGSSFAFSFASTLSYCTGSIVAFSGVDVTGGVTVTGAAGGPFDVKPGSISTGTLSPLTVTSITTSHNNAVVVMFGMDEYTGNPGGRTFTTWSTTSPGTLAKIYDNNGATYQETGAAWGTQTAAGSTGPTGSITFSGGGNLGGILIALKPIPPCIPPSAPTVTTPVKFCQNTTATALTATGTSLLWYTSATGGTGSSTAPTPVTTTVGTTPYYVSQTVGCESQRAEIDVVINALPVSSVTGQTNITCNAATDGTITISATGGTGTYLFSVDDGGTYKPDDMVPVSPPYVYGGLIANNAYRIKVKDGNGCISK